MLTLTTPVPKEFAAAPRVSSSRSVGWSCHPPKLSPRRTRSHVLRMLTGADSGRFPYLPRRRPVR